MALPNGITTRTYTGTITGLDGANATGTLEFRLPNVLRDLDDNVVVGNDKTLTATVTAGAFSIALPIAPWPYIVRITTDVLNDVYLLPVTAGTGSLHFADTYGTTGTTTQVEFFALLHHLHTTGDITGLTSLLDDLTDRLDTLETTPPGGGVTDHGALTGLADDDHGQYYNAARLSTVLAGYATASALTAGLAGKEATGAAAALAATLAPVATAGTYTSLTGKPAIPAVPGDIGAQPAGDYATNGALTTGLSGKANSGHTHAITDTTGLQTALNAAGGDRELYPPSAAGYVEWTADPQICSADFGHSNGTLLMVRFRNRSATTIAELGFAVTSAASGPGAYSGVALYEDGTGIVNRLGQSADAGTQWTSQGAKSIPLAAPVTVIPGAYYRAAILWQGSGNGRIAGTPLVILDALMNAGVRRSTFLAGQSGFPASVTVSAMSTNNAMYWLSMK